MAGEVVVITGASAGVGRATVREFANHGASVGLIARGQDGLEQCPREYGAVAGAQHSPVRLDEKQIAAQAPACPADLPA